MLLWICGYHAGDEDGGIKSGFLDRTVGTPWLWELWWGS